ncbi:hypothetical protein ACQQ2Q_04835 [Agrobacterium sp. ES01]|uniref:hypothetical protein n=1 Tax=Agrobacterium sp. ES01 TaxID=3420714 RepID=UPI003D14101B
MLKKKDRYENMGMHMFARIAAAIWRFMSSIGIDIWKGRFDILNWCDNVIRAPFHMVFGHDAGAPSYTPDVQTSDLLKVLKDSRQAAQAEARRLDRNGIETVLEFAGAHRDTRAMMTLPESLDPRVRAGLLTMDDSELRRLRASGIGQVRKFLDCKPHGIVGVPSFGEHIPASPTETPPKGMSINQAMVWRIRQQMLKPTESEPYEYPRKARP